MVASVLTTNLVVICLSKLEILSWHWLKTMKLHFPGVLFYKSLGQAEKNNALTNGSLINAVKVFQSYCKNKNIKTF